jgi:hypothetical protein
MTFSVGLSDPAKAEVDEIVVWMTGRSPRQGKRWYDAFTAALDSLEEMPTRCPIAEEADYFRVEVRQLRFQDYRILFRLIDADGDGVEDRVDVLHVRHLARRPLYTESGEN